MNSASDSARMFPRGFLGLAAAAFVSLGVAGDAASATLGVLTYEVNDSSVAITACDYDAAGAVVVPAKIEGRTVTKIANFAFDRRMGITEVTLPPGVTKIGIGAFSDCEKLRKINLPPGLKSIGAGAFEYTDLREVNVPGGVEAILDATFSACKRLEKVELGEGVRVIGYEAFSFCDRLESLSLPASITDVTPLSFDVTYLKRIDVAAGSRTYSSVDGVLYDKNRTALIFCPTKKPGALKIPEGVKRLGEKCLAGCSLLTSVELPQSLVAIEARAFESCRGLTKIDLPDGLTRIGHHAFVGVGVQDITIPASVDRIGGRAFVSSGLRNIYFQGNAPSRMGEHVFATSHYKRRVPTTRTVYFYEGSEGFTEPTWMDCKTVALDPETPVTNKLLFGAGWPN